MNGNLNYIQIHVRWINPPHDNKKISDSYNTCTYFWSIGLDVSGETEEKISCCSLPQLPTNISVRLTALGGNPGLYPYPSRCGYLYLFPHRFARECE